MTVEPRARATFRIGATERGGLGIIRFACDGHLHFEKLDPGVRVLVRPYDGPRRCDFCRPGGPPIASSGE